MLIILMQFPLLLLILFTISSTVFLRVDNFLFSFLSCLWYFTLSLFLRPLPPMTLFASFSLSSPHFPHPFPFLILTFAILSHLLFLLSPLFSSLPDILLPRQKLFFHFSYQFSFSSNFFTSLFCLSQLVSFFLLFPFSCLYLLMILDSTFFTTFAPLSNSLPTRTVCAVARFLCVSFCCQLSAY